MAFSTKPNDLAREVRTSSERLEKKRALWDELVQGYHGSAWDEGTQPSPGGRYATHTYEYVSLMLPKLIHQNPRFSLSTTRGGRQAVITRALERGINHWSQASRLQEPLEAIALDALMLVGGGYIEEVPNERMRLTDEQREAMQGTLRRPKSLGSETPEDADQPYWPRVKRLEPFRWGWDLSATTDDKIRFWWHKVTEDKDELLRRASENKDELWRTEAIQDLMATRDAKELGYAHDGTPERNQVTYYVVWVPDGRLSEDPADDEHGVIYTIACGQEKGDSVSGSFLRDPYYFYGPAQGPYVKMGFYCVPNSTLPLSPVVATRDSADIVARVHKSIVRRVEKYRKGAVYDLKDKRDIERIENSTDMDLIGVTGFSGQLGQYEVGGVTQQDLEHYRFLLERLQSASGMDDVQRGNVTGSGTATEVAIASEGSQERVSYLIGKWRQFVSDVAMRVSWYAAHDDRIVFSYRVEEDQRAEIAGEAVQAGMMDQPQSEAFMRDGSMSYAGGDFNDDDLLFGDLDFDVEPYSMQRRDQRTRKMDTLEALNMLSSFGAAAMQGVPIRFDKVAQLLADVYALPEIEEVVNSQLAEQQGLLSMEERMVAMEKDSAGGPGAGGGQAKPVRSQRPAPPSKPEAKTQRQTF